MMAACFALLLSSCVTNEESQSVTDIRNAKAEQLKSLAALNNAEAAAAKVLADAEAALKAAQAEAEAAKAAQIQAQIANDKLIAEAEAAMLKAEAAYQEALAAQIEEQIEKAKLEYDALKAEYAARIAAAEQAKAEAEKAKAEAIAALELVTINAQKALAEAKKELANEEQLLKEKLEEIDGKNAVNLTALYSAYKALVEDLYDAQETLVGYKKSLIAAEAGLVTAQESAASLVESNKEYIAYYEREIGYANAQIEYLQKYVTMTEDEAYAAVRELQVKNNELVYAANDLIAQKSALETAMDELTLNGFETFLKTSALFRNTEMFPLGCIDAEGNDRTAEMETYQEYLWEQFSAGWLEINSMEDFNALVAQWAENNNYLMVHGRFVADESSPYEKNKFVPLFYANTTYSDPVTIEYSLNNSLTPSNYEYTTIEGIGLLDVDGIKAYFDEQKETKLNNNETGLANAEKNLAKAEVELDTWTAILEKATAWKSAYDEWRNLYRDAYFSVQYRDETTGEYVSTTAKLYNTAVAAEKTAKGAYDAAVKKVDDLKEDLAYYDTKEYLWSLEDAVEDATEADAAAKETLKAKQDALKAAQDTLVVKNTAAAKAVEALEAAKVKEREALKAWEAAKKVQAAAQKVVDDVVAAGGAPTTDQNKALTDANTAADKAKKAYTNPSPAEGESKGAKELREAAEEALSKANQAVEDAEDDVENAENAVKAAQAAADKAAEALVAAKTALDNLKAGKDENVLELKKRIALAEEAVEPFKTAWDEAVKAVEEAEAAVEAAKAKLVPELEEAILDAQIEYETLAGKNAVTVDATLDDDKASYYSTKYKSCISAAVEAAAIKYEKAVKNVQEKQAVVDDYKNFTPEDVEEWLAELAVAETYFKDNEAQVAEYNALVKECAELYVEYLVAYDEYKVVNAEYQAAVKVWNNVGTSDIEGSISGLEDAIANYEELIETLNEQIADVENGINEGVLNAEALVAEWTEKVEIQQTYVELLEADVAAAKAEFDAAVEAAAKAE